MNSQLTFTSTVVQEKVHSCIIKVLRLLLTVEGAENSGCGANQSCCDCWRNWHWLVFLGRPDELVLSPDRSRRSSLVFSQSVTGSLECVREFKLIHLKWFKPTRRVEHNENKTNRLAMQVPCSDNVCDLSTLCAQSRLFIWTLLSVLLSQVIDFINLVNASELCFSRNLLIENNNVVTHTSGLHFRWRCFTWFGLYLTLQKYKIAS